LKHIFARNATLLSLDHSVVNVEQSSYSLQWAVYLYQNLLLKIFTNAGERGTFSCVWGYSSHTERHQNICLLKCLFSRPLETSLAVRLNWFIVPLSAK